MLSTILFLKPTTDAATKELLWILPSWSYLDTTDQRVSVKKVIEGSLAEASGILAGDTIVSINQVQVTEVLDLTWELRQVKDGERVQITVERSGDRLDLDIIAPENGS